MTSCTATAYDGSYFAMNTVMQLTVYGNRKVLAECGKLLSSLDLKLSATHPAGPVYALNERGTPVTDPTVLEVAREALRISALSDGAFDVTIYPVVSLWGFPSSDYHVPTQEELDQALSKVGYQHLLLTEDSLSLPEGCQIDLGAIGKGFAGDLLRQYLKDKGVKNALLNLGGNVVAMGSKPDGKPFRIAIKDPVGEGYVCVLSISDTNVVTSGLYERYFERDGVRYGHIIDPSTGRPVDNEWLSVTVVGESGIDCDAWSTALFVMGVDKACAKVRELGLEVVMVTGDTLYVSESLQSKIQYQGAYASYRVVTL